MLKEAILKLREDVLLAAEENDKRTMQKCAQMLMAATGLKMLQGRMTLEKTAKRVDLDDFESRGHTGQVHTTKGRTARPEGKDGPTLAYTSQTVRKPEKPAKAVAPAAEKAPPTVTATIQKGEGVMGRLKKLPRSVKIGGGVAAGSALTYGGYKAYKHRKEGRK